MIQMVKYAFDWIENIVGKGRKVGYLHFSFLTMFSKALYGKGLRYTWLHLEVVCFTASKSPFSEGLYDTGNRHQSTVQVREGRSLAGDIFKSAICGPGRCAKVIGGPSSEKRARYVHTLNKVSISSVLSWTL